jgi:hypothetical protein
VSTGLGWIIGKTDSMAVDVSKLGIISSMITFQLNGCKPVFRKADWIFTHVITCRWACEYTSIKLSFVTTSPVSSSSLFLSCPQLVGSGPLRCMAGYSSLCLWMSSS